MHKNDHMYQGAAINSRSGEAPHYTGEVKELNLYNYLEESGVVLSTLDENFHNGVINYFEAVNAVLAENNLLDSKGQGVLSDEPPSGQVSPREYVGGYTKDAIITRMIAANIVKALGLKG